MGYPSIKEIAVTIDSGVALSNSAALDGGVIIGIDMPAAWTAAGLSFQGSTDDATFLDIYDEIGEVVLVSGVVAVDRRIVLPPAAYMGLGRFVKVRSGTTGTPVNQGADRIITLLVRTV